MDRTGRRVRGRRLAGRGRVAVPAVVLVTGMTGLYLVAGHEADPRPGPPQPAAGAERVHPGTAVPARSSPAATPLPPSPAVRVRIPSIGVDAPVTKVGLDEDGWAGPPAPQGGDLAGWFSDSATPGAEGTSVLDGHAGTPAGRGVFHGLGDVRKGSTVEVVRADGRTVVFTVYGVEVLPEHAFPGARVYGDTGRPELRVLTCGGGFTGHDGRDGNVVLFGRLGRTPGPGTAMRP